MSCTLSDLIALFSTSHPTPRDTKDLCRSTGHGGQRTKEPIFIPSLCLDLALIGVWSLSGRFGALRPEGRRVEFQSSHNVGILGKYFTPSCLWRLGVLTPTQYYCCSR